MTGKQCRPDQKVTKEFSPYKKSVWSPLKAYITVTKQNLQVLNPCPVEPGYAHTFANSVDPYQLASSEANWSGSALFASQYLNIYQQPGSSNLIGWKLEVGMAY